MFAGLDDDDVRKIVRGNAIRMLHLDLDPLTPHFGVAGA